MARTKHTMRRRRHRGGGDDPTTPPAESRSTWEVLSDTFGNLTPAPTAAVPTAAVPTAAVPTAAVAPTAEASGGKKRHKHPRGGSGHSHGVATYATTVGGRRRCHKGGSHGVGVAAYASPYTQGGGKRRRRRRRTRRRQYKK